jgi:hypothetical protein
VAQESVSGDEFRKWLATIDAGRDVAAACP